MKVKVYPIGVGVIPGKKGLRLIGMDKNGFVVELKKKKKRKRPNEN